MEHELGSIAVGKLANFTVLSEDPYTVDPERLNRIPVLGTVFPGRWFATRR
jgi:predicted amidohydrolase YtcJ